MNPIKTNHGPVILTEWILAGAHCPTVEIWEDQTHFYQVHRQSKNVRKAEKFAKQGKYGDWYLVTNIDQFS